MKELGQFLRNRYVTERPFIREFFTKKEVSVNQHCFIVS